MSSKGQNPAPWGVPNAGFTPVFPSHFPPKVIEVVQRLRLQEGPIGENIQGVAIRMIDHVFNAEAFQIAENLLTLASVASDAVLQAAADTLATYLNECWSHPNQCLSLEFVIMDGIIMGGASRDLEDFLHGLSDAQVQAAYGQDDITAEETIHKLLVHMAITSQPTSNVVCDVRFTTCDAYVWDYPKGEGRTLADVQQFMGTLATVPLAEMEEGATCSVCWMTFAELAPEEHGLKLPCGHVFSDKCLQKLLGPKPEGWGHKLCPICRQEVRFNRHMGWVFQAGRGSRC